MTTIRAFRSVLWTGCSKAASKATRLIVVVLLLASAFLLAVITWGGWNYLVGAKPLQEAYILIFLVLAFYVIR